MPCDRLQAGRQAARYSWNSTNSLARAAGLEAEAGMSSAAAPIRLIIVAVLGHGRVRNVTGSSGVRYGRRTYSLAAEAARL